MNGFLNELSGDFVSDRDFQLDTDLIYKSDCLKRIIVVPSGFITDFASFQLLDMRLSTGKRSATLHDYLYRTKGIASKKEADDVYLEAMKSQNIGFFWRWKNYLGVRWFGKSSYKGGI